MENPWIVENIEAFHFYCCPECGQKYQESEEFQKHAVNQHPKAKVLFAKTDIKSEHTEEDYEKESQTELEVSTYVLITVRSPSMTAVSDIFTKKSCLVIIRDLRNICMANIVNYDFHDPISVVIKQEMS